MPIVYAVLVDPVQGRIQLQTTSPSGIFVNATDKTWVRRVVNNQSIQVPIGAFPVVRERGLDNQTLMVLDSENLDHIQNLVHGMLEYRKIQLEECGWRLQPG